RSESARGPVPSSISSPTPSSRGCCSSVPARRATPSTPSTWRTWAASRSGCRRRTGRSSSAHSRSPACFRSPASGRRTRSCSAPGLFGGAWFGRLIENDVFVTAKVHTWDFSVPAALLSTVVVVAAIGTGYYLWFLNRQPRGVTQRNALARAGYTFLDNRYYLDHVYTGGVAGGMKGPIARGAYWINQNVIDGVVNGGGTGAE